MKKTAGVLSFLLGLSLVSAGPVEGTRQLLEGARQILGIVIQFIFDLSYDLEMYNQFLFAKIILMILIFIIVYTVIKTTIFQSYAKEKNFKILYVISAAISILAIKYLPNEYIQAILLPYSSLGVGLAVFLPLFIYFYFIENSFANQNTFVRRAAWVIFGASFIALWFSRYDELGQANWIYWIGIAFIILCFIFDKHINTYFKLNEYREHRRHQRHLRYAEIQGDIAQIENQLKSTLPKGVEESLKRRIEHLEKEQARLVKLGFP